MRYRDKIVDYFEQIPDSTMVSANQLYQDHFTKMSDAAFFKALERLAKDGVIQRVGKGLYSKPQKAEADAEAVLNYYFGENNNNGMYIGYSLYAKYGLTSVRSNDIELYSNIAKKQNCNIGHIHVKKLDIELTFENTKIIEALEILQNYYQIEELNKLKFAKYARQFARGYNDEAAIHVINHIKYKKSTIAFMKKILDMYAKKNTLGQFLSYASRYKIPPVQRVAR